MRGITTIRRIALLAVVALAWFASGTLAQDGADKQSDGEFTGIAIVTSNLNWFDLFSRPETPHIQGQGTFKSGERGAVAIIFSNAEPRNGVIKVECDITNFDVEGSKVVVEGGKYYEGPYGGDDVLHPAMLDLQFEIIESDPVGRAGFVIVLRDVHSGRSVELEVAFDQGTGA